MREEGKTFHVLCASIAPHYARLRDDFSAVMVLPEQTKPAGGKVDEGSKGASEAEDSFCHYFSGRWHEEGGRRGPRAQRAAGGQWRPTHTGPTRQDRWGRAAGMKGPSHGRPTGATGAAQAVFYPPHPSQSLPFAGEHSCFLKGAPLKRFLVKCKPENALSAHTK